MNKLPKETTQKIHQHFQKAVREVCLLADNMFEENKIFWNLPGEDQISESLENIALPNIKTNTDWKPTEKNRSEKFEHVLKDSTFTTLEEAAQLFIAADLWWNENLPESIQKKLDTWQRTIPTCIEEFIHMNLKLELDRAISYYKQQDLLDDYQKDTEPLLTVKEIQTKHMRVQQAPPPTQQIRKQKP